MFEKKYLVLIVSPQTIKPASTQTNGQPRMSLHLESSHLKAVSFSYPFITTIRTKLFFKSISYGFINGMGNGNRDVLVSTGSFAICCIDINPV